MLSRLAHRPIGIFVRWTLTMYLVLLGWLLFRVADYDHLRYAVKAFVFFDGRTDVTGLGAGTASPFTAIIALLVFVVLHTYRFFGKRWSDVLDAAPRTAQVLFYVLMGFVFFFAWPNRQEPFIYFQF